MRTKLFPQVKYEATPVPTYDIKRVVIESNGQKKTVLQRVLRTTDPNEQYDAEDFSLQSLLDSGATDLLREIGPLSPDEFTATDAINAAATSIESQLNSNS